MERYRIEATLGAGGQALVSRAVDVVLGRPVAIKALAPPFGGNVLERDRERLQREARALAALSHPHIPAIYDIDLNSSPPRIVSEFIDGDNLLTILNGRRPSIRETCRWILQACSALSHAHANGVIHRDIKPANMILRRADGTCCLVDFGLAVLPGDSLQTSSRFLGTPGYMSPEHLRGELVDARTDVFSLAVTTYQLIANKLPAPEDYEPLASIDPAIPVKLDDVLRESLGARSRRPADAAEFSARLQDAISVSVSVSDLTDNARLLGLLERALVSTGDSQHHELVGQLRATQQRLLRVHGLVDDGLVGLSDLGIRSGAQGGGGLLIPLKAAIKKFSREYVLEALNRNAGNRTQAARVLGVDVRTIFRYLAAGDLEE